MNNDFNERVALYQYGDINNVGFQNRLNNYSYAPTRNRTYYNSNWYDAFSSLMQSLYETSISSLNDDNRNDEKEIELLEEASSITDSDLQNLEELVSFYNQQYKDAKDQSNNALASHYKELYNIANMEYRTKRSIIQKADNLVRDDKNLISFSGHNPILEAIGEIFDTTSTVASVGAGTGSAVGSIIPGAGNTAGAAIGGIVGGIGGFGYGVYDLFSSGRTEIDRSAYTEPESNNRFENYANSIKTRQSYKDFRAKQIQEQQNDLFQWKTEYPVSDYYRAIEQSGQGNYAYYNLPGVIGSSFSDTKDMGEQIVTSVGINKLANKIPNSKLRFATRAVGFLSALRNGWQQSLNENHAEASETSVKKAIDQIKKNKDLRNEMLSNAKKVAINLYNLDESDADKLIDDEVAFTMYQGGIGGLNPRKLQNSYDYYKSARQLGDLGADTQFERDMMATAAGDILESALMVTPYGALARKSKLIGRGIAGAAVGAAAGEFLGFGVGGTIIGGGIGALAAQNRFARRLWRNQMRKVQAIEDKILPQLERQIMFDKAVHAASAFGVTALAEAAEEGTQYLNSLDAEKILSEADDKISLRNMTNLFINDLKKRGEVFNAVLSQFGLTDSPYQDDQEFWSNWKGGLVLGGLMTGATVSLTESIGAKKAYQAAKFLQDEILSTAVANRVESQDAILKGAAFAKYGVNGDLSDILDIIDRAKSKNKNRIHTVYSDKDFDDLSEQANRIISKLNHKTTKQRLTQLGYEIGSDEANYAIAVNDYYQQKTRQNRQEEKSELAQKIELMNDPSVIEALNTIAGEEPMQADEFDDTGNRFTYKSRNANGDIEEKTITNRERLLLLHQNSAELIAIAQLLKDLQDIQTIQEFAKSKGIAFSKNQLYRTISLLKDKYNLLKNDVELYANEQFDSTTTTYDQQIEHIKGYLLNQEAGLKLADLYRNSTLRMLNQMVYTNIIKSIAIDTDSNASNKEVAQQSKSIVKQFIDNVQKNKQLQEILDYNIENESANTNSSEQEQAAGTNDTGETSTPEESIGEQEATSDAELHEKESESLFSRIKNKIKNFFSKKQDDVEEELNAEDEEDLEITPEEESQIIEAEQSKPVEEDTTPKEDTAEQPQQQGEQTEQFEAEGSVAQPEDTESVAIPEDPEDTNNPIIPSEETQQQAEVIPEESESVAIPGEPENAIIIDEEEAGKDSTPVVNNQEETINRLQQPDENAPRKLTDGWYVTKDGRIIPSDKMYMANPVETSKKGGVEMATKYRLVAAQIRFNIHRYLKQKEELGLKKYVGKILKTADPVVIDTITKALLNNDQNAVKLLILHENPRAQESYYTNEFFRDAARRILNGEPIKRPNYIDKDVFKNFCRQVILYKKRAQSVYGYKFVTNLTPSVTKINGEDVVADPDFIAVDTAGNAHIINVYTINNSIYKKQQQTAEHYQIDLRNTNFKFSQHQEKSVLADIQVKGIKDGRGVIISSTSLLPVVVDGYTAIHRLYLGKFIPIIPNNDSITKYANQENQLLELKELLVKANEKAKQVIDELNDNIEKLIKYRQDSNKTKYTYLRKKKFNKDSEPTSIAEAYAQLDKALEAIQDAQQYYTDNMAKEIEEMEAFYKEKGREDKKFEISKEIERINKMPDETQTAGIQVEIVDGDDIIYKKDLLTHGVVKASVKTAPNGNKYVAYSIEYKGKEYRIKIYVNRARKYGIKNGGIFEQNVHPNYTKKKAEIDKLLLENPNLILTLDLRRSFIRYAEDVPSAKPRDLIGADGLLTSTDVENLGVQQNDGKIVDIGFYDEKTGVIQTGQNNASATLAHAPEGGWYQNQLFLVIKQNHLEEKSAPARTVAIPLVRPKFKGKLAQFIATCFKIIAETNHQAGYDSQKKRMLANQMLHLFIGTRKTYEKGKQELPNIIYTYGYSVRIN